MSDKERLEDIKSRYMEHEYDFNLKNVDIKWLIKQAERAQKNAQDLEDMDKQLASEQKRVEKLKKDLNALHYVYNLQAERVQELEKRIENLNELTDIQHEQNLRFYKQLNQLIRTNQRYKQALEEIIRQHELEDEIDDYDFMWNVKQIARQALEGEK